jgi:hypothetical protein
MEPLAEESSAAFVMRAETARRSVGIEANQAYHAFAKRFLDPNLKA